MDAGMGAKEAEVIDAERTRHAALIAADLAELDRLHAKDFSWIHASGRRDDRAGLLELVGSRTMVFQSIRPTRERVRLYGDAAVLTYDVDLNLQTPGAILQRHNKVCVIWVSGGEALRVVHWQSTATPPVARRTGGSQGVTR
jgi:hypothetical protein